MNPKCYTLIGFLIIWSLNGYSQHDPNNEILVFFSNGVSQKITTDKGKSLKTSHITNEYLKKSLNAFGIDDSLIEVAIPEFEKADTLKILANGEKVQQADMTKLFKIKVPQGQHRKDLLKKINLLPEVLYAESNGYAVFFREPNDIQFKYQWGLKNISPSYADINADKAWDIYTGNSNNIIAIIDDGVQISHSDLNDKISGGDVSYGYEGHGTKVAGIAAAETNTPTNTNSIAGVDWFAKIHSQNIDDLEVSGIH